MAMQRQRRKRIRRWRLNAIICPNTDLKISFNIMHEADKYLSARSKTAHGFSGNMHATSHTAESSGDNLPRDNAHCSCEVCGNIGALTGLALLSGLFAFVSAIVRQLTLGFPDILAAVMVAPPVEEILKAALPIMVLEHRTNWLGRGKDLLWFAMGSALVFSVIENLLYTFVYLDNPSVEMLQWRWTACTAMHVAATGLTGVGLMRAYNRAHVINQKPRFVWEWPWLAGAIAVHMAYNSFAVMSAVN